MKCMYVYICRSHNLLRYVVYAADTLFLDMSYRHGGERLNYWSGRYRNDVPARKNITPRRVGSCDGCLRSRLTVGLPLCHFLAETFSEGRCSLDRTCVATFFVVYLGHGIDHRV